MYIEKPAVLFRYVANWLTGGAFRRIERRLAKLETLVAQNNDGQIAMHSAIFDARQEATIREFRRALQRQT